MSDSERISAFIARIYDDGVVTGEDGSSFDIRPLSVTPERGRFITDLCRREGVCTALEIGMAWGLSTLCILEALTANDAKRAAHVVTDPFQTANFHRAALQSIRQLGLERMVEFHEEPSELLLPKMVAEGRTFDFVFIDGNHRFDGVFVDLVYAHRLLKPGGIMLFDDTWSDPVFLACRYLEANYRYPLITAYPAPRPGRSNRRPFRGQMRAYRKPADAQPEGRFYFVPFHEPMPFRDEAEHRLRAEGMRAMAEGERAAARRAFRAAARLNPRRVKTYLRLIRTYLPAGMARALGSSADSDDSR